LKSLWLWGRQAPSAYGMVGERRDEDALAEVGVA